MCGIGGIFTRGGPMDLATAAARMAGAQRHRGPDDEGIVVVAERSPGVALLHRRLSIIDVSSAGHQPMVDRATGCVLVFNGEIYNFQQLRAQLVDLGHPFESDSDSEVILKAFAEWGAEGVKRLRGIFAFAIWDPRDRSLLLARDRLGVKPLYFHDDGRTLVFASEVRALLASGLVPRQLDFDGLDGFLRYGSVQEPATLVKGVTSLARGALMHVSERGSATQAYWSLTPEPTLGTSSYAEAVATVRRKLDETVASQLIADVPLGAFLSGGIDSTAVSAVMRRTTRAPVHTFSLGFNEPRYDERVFAEAVARRIGSEHTTLVLEPHVFAEELPKALAAYDQPSVDGINTYFVSMMARRAGLKVALSGVGGDEVFVGYNGFRKNLALARFERQIEYLPYPARRLLSVALSGWSGREGVRKARQLLERRADADTVARQLRGSAQIGELCPGLAGREPTPSLAASTGVVSDAVNHVSEFEMGGYMLSTLLRDTDQMSMAHGLEVRVPLVDHELVQLVLGIPGPLKIQAGRSKPLLVDAVGEDMPREAVERRKMGFELPIKPWLRAELHRDPRLLLRDVGGGVFSAAALQRATDEFLAGRSSWSRIWSLRVVTRWLAEHRIEA